MLLPADYLAIERLYAEYNRAIHKSDAAAWANCFTPDGVFSNIFRTVAGADALESYAAGFMEDRNSRYLINNLVIEAEDGGATGTCYLVILRFDGLGEGLSVELTGIYFDALVRYRGEWKFARRHIQRDLAEA